MHKVLKHAALKVPAVRKLLDEHQRLSTDKGVLQLEKGQLEADVRQYKSVAQSPRTFLAHQFLHGSGIEVGAAHHPLELPPDTDVKYVDVFSADDLRKAFPLEYKTAAIVDVDIIDDAEKLAKFKASSLDFIIANHFLEHCLDPIGTVINMFEKLRPNGILYMAIPDMRYTFDRDRALTTYEHLLEEHKDATKQKFRKDHTLEYVKLAIPIDKHYSKAEMLNHDVATQVQELLDSDYRIHYHVWTQRQITDMFARMALDFNIDLEIEALMKNQHEVIYVLRKSGANTRPA